MSLEVDQTVLWLLLKPGPKPWARTLKNLDPEKPGPERPGPRKTMTLKNLGSQKT